MNSKSKIGINEFLQNVNLAYEFRRLESPDTDRCQFMMAYTYGQLPNLDRLAYQLGTKVLSGGTTKLNTQFDGVTPTIAEYLLDSWYQTLLTQYPRVTSQLRIPEEEISRIRNILNEVRPMGAL